MTTTCFPLTSMAGMAELAGTERDVAAAERIAVGKNAVAPLAAALACSLGGTEALLAELDRAVLDLITAVQTLDDAADWRADLSRGQLSLVTARIWSQRGHDIAAPAAEALVYRVVLPEVLQRGCAALADATTLPALQNSPGWARLIDKIAAAYDHTLAAMPSRDRVARAGVER